MMYHWNRETGEITQVNLMSASPVQLRLLTTSDRTLVKTVRGGVTVSAVFLGVDHAFPPGSPPVLWETMIYLEGGEFLDYQRRYRTQSEALAGHTETVADLKMILDEHREAA